MLKVSEELVHQARLYDGRACCVIGGGNREVLTEPLWSFPGIAVSANNHHRDEATTWDLAFLAGRPSDHPKRKAQRVFFDWAEYQAWAQTSEYQSGKAFPFYNARFEQSSALFMQLQPFSGFANVLRCRPFTGINAIMWMSLLPVAGIIIDGFDFYYDDERDEVPLRGGPHVVKPQALWLAKLIDSDPRVKFSKRLAHAIELALKHPDAGGCAVNTDADGLSWLSGQRSASLI